MGDIFIQIVVGFIAFLLGRNRNVGIGMNQHNIVYIGHSAIPQEKRSKWINASSTAYRMPFLVSIKLYLSDTKLARDCMSTGKGVIRKTHTKYFTTQNVQIAWRIQCRKKTASQQCRKKPHECYSKLNIFKVNNLNCKL